MNTIPIGQVWGGTRVYDPKFMHQILDATQDFTENFHDPRAGIFVTSEVYLANLADMILVFYFYNGETPPLRVFDKFNAIKAKSDAVKTQSYSSLLVANNKLAALYGFRYLIRGTTIPNLPGANGTALYTHHYDTWRARVKSKSLEAVLNLGSSYVIDFQPLPCQIPAASLNTNPARNALGLKLEDGDRVLMSYDVAWLDKLGDEESNDIARNWTSEIEQYVQDNYANTLNTHYEGDDPTADRYKFRYMNDAMFDQKPLQSYGDDNYQRVKAIQKAYDPTRLFHKRTGGFKLDD